MFMDAVEIELLKLEDFAYHQVQKLGQGRGEEDVRRRNLQLLPKAAAAASYTGFQTLRTLRRKSSRSDDVLLFRRMALPVLLGALAAASQAPRLQGGSSVVETAARGNGLIEDGVGAALERSMRIGRGGIMLRLSDDQFTAIGGVPAATPVAADNIGAGRIFRPRPDYRQTGPKTAHQNAPRRVRRFRARVYIVPSAFGSRPTVMSDQLTTCGRSPNSESCGLHCFRRQPMTRPTPASFTVRLGHPLLILFWSVWMILLGVVSGIYFHPSHGAAVEVSIACGAMIVVHEMVEGFIWCSLTAWWIGRCQSQLERAIE